jgi:type I restriction enzyme S subunit
MVEVETKIERYDKYKDSGVECLGVIPENWQANKLKYVLTEINERSETGEEELLSLSKTKGVIPKSTLGDRSGQANSLIGYKKVYIDALVINKMQAVNGLLSVSKISGITSPDYSVYRTKENNDINYFGYLLNQPVYLDEFKKVVTGVMEGFIRLYTDDLYNIKAHIPSLKEQTAIAQFLDDKTTKIDEAITIKQQQISLLKERKQILIHKAVTRGLDDSVKLKGSGVEWIGLIPEGWEVKKLKYILNEKLKYGANESGIDYDVKLPRYVRITDFGNDGKLSEKNKLSLSWNNGRDYLLKDGDILFARSGATVGKTYQFKKSMSIENDYCFAGYLIKAEANEKIILSDFLYLFTNSELFNNWKDSIFIKATIENIGADKYSQLSVIIPPVDEQKEILFRYEKDSNKIETAISLKQQEIAKLKEYKSSLINSVVTGKVKVC